MCLCILVGLFGVADAHVQGGMVGDMALMLPEFIQVRSWLIVRANFLVAIV